MKLTFKKPQRRNYSPTISAALGLGGAAAGAGLVYWFDAERGPRRRAEVKQKALHASKKGSEALGVTARDLAGRTRGFFAELRAGATDIRARGRGESEDDQVLCERVRSKLGRVCSHPRAIEVTARAGRVELSGPVMELERERVLRSVLKVRGVREINDRLEGHLSAADTPALQGRITRVGERPELFQESWSPTTRVLVCGAGAGLLGWGATQRGLLGAGAGAVGIGCLLRGLTNLPFKRLVGVGAGRRAVDLQKEIHIHAPPEEVFAMFRQFESFPRFMTHVLEVVPQREGCWRWTVTGPAGMPVSFDAEITRIVPNELIAWKSLGHPSVRSAGVVRFEPDRGGTRLNIKLSYNPPAGAIGHALASLIGADPKKQLDDDMLRFKSLLEVGKATGRMETVTRDELTS